MSLLSNLAILSAKPQTPEASALLKVIQLHKKQGLVQNKGRSCAQEGKYHNTGHQRNTGCKKRKQSLKSNSEIVHKLVYKDDCMIFIISFHISKSPVQQNYKKI